MKAITDYQWAQKMLAPEHAENPYFVVFTAQRLRDLACILKYGKTWEELGRNDEGILELIALFKDAALQDPTARARYGAAKEMGDDLFVERYQKALGHEPNVDARWLKLEMFPVILWLYMNWEYPLMVPDLPTGFCRMTDSEIIAWFEKFGTVWFPEKAQYENFLNSFGDLKKLEKLRHRLGLKKAR